LRYLAEAVAVLTRLEEFASATFGGNGHSPELPAVPERT
jgi:hypothetical protein